MHKMTNPWSDTSNNTSNNNSNNQPKSERNSNNSNFNYFEHTQNSTQNNINNPNTNSSDGLSNSNNNIQPNIQQNVQIQQSNTLQNNNMPQQNIHQNTTPMNTSHNNTNSANNGSTNLNTQQRRMDSSFFNSSLPQQQKITVENNNPTNNKNFDNNASSEINQQNYSQINMQGNNNNSINAVHHNAANNNSQVQIPADPQNAAQTSPNQATQNVQLAQLTPPAIAQEVSALSGNSNCADCKMILDKTDKWAILHFGIYVCEDCKLNHEQMITHMIEFNLPVSEIISELEPENFQNPQNSNLQNSNFSPLMQLFHQKCCEHEYHNQKIAQPKILQMIFTETEIEQCSEGNNTVLEPPANWSMFDYFSMTRFGGNDRVNANFEKDIPSWYYKLSLTDPTEFKLNWLLMKYLSKFKSQLEGKLFIPNVTQDVNQIITHFNKTRNNPVEYITPPNIKFQLIKVSVGQGFEKSYRAVFQECWKFRFFPENLPK